MPPLRTTIPCIRRKQEAILRLAAWFPPAIHVRNWLFRLDRALFLRQFRPDPTNPQPEAEQRREFILDRLRQRGWTGQETPWDILSIREAPSA
jgi:hypothetical protein